jgi:hypothetical protein
MSALQNKYQGINITQVGQDLYIEGFVGILNKIDTKINYLQENQKLK